ncbi:MAG TPA: acyltransferase [Flavisolibacter sp.]|nr:acyltransferase [Flavisolibacter sp.]
MNTMMMNNLSGDVLKSKKHFEVLDGLRGVAALAVVIFHFMEWVFTDFSKNFIAHGFLAVDFFFCLSGFVIGYAYDDRMPRLGAKAFFTSRLIRLHPLVIPGSLLGFLAFLVDPFLTPPATYSPGTLLLLLLGSLFLIPLPLMEERAFNLFAFNAPSWSLFWEYIVNLLYALVLFRIGRRSLVVVTGLAALALCFVSYRAGNLLGGWNGASFWDGGARVAYSFSAGLLIYRSNWIIKNKLGFAAMAFLLSLAFILPWTQWNWILEPAIVVLYFPLIVALGAGSSVTAGMKRLCTFSGNISYPLYTTHYAAIWIFGNFFTITKPGMGEVTVVIISGVAFLVVVAYLAMVFYDVPLRKYLNRKRQNH